MNYPEVLIMFVYVYTIIFLMEFALIAALHKMNMLGLKMIGIIALVTALNIGTLMNVFIRWPEGPEVLMVISVIQIFFLAVYTFGVTRRNECLK